MAYPNDLPFGRNAEQIRCQASRVIRGRMPAEVRRELMDAVAKGFLGRLKKDGLKPEVFFHPDHKNGAIERQRREAEYAVSCVAQVMATDERAKERHAQIDAMFA